MINYEIRNLNEIICLKIHQILLATKTNEAHLQRRSLHAVSLCT